MCPLPLDRLKNVGLKRAAGLRSALAVEPTEAHWVPGWSAEDLEGIEAATRPQRAWLDRALGREMTDMSLRSSIYRIWETAYFEVLRHERGFAGGAERKGEREQEHSTEVSIGDRRRNLSRCRNLSRWFPLAVGYATASSLRSAVLYLHGRRVIPRSRDPLRSPPPRPAFVVCTWAGGARNYAEFTRAAASARAAGLPTVATFHAFWRPLREYRHLLAATEGSDYAVIEHLSLRDGLLLPLQVARLALRLQRQALRALVRPREGEDGPTSLRRLPEPQWRGLTRLVVRNLVDALVAERFTERLAQRVPADGAFVTAATLAWSEATNRVLQAHGVRTYHLQHGVAGQLLLGYRTAVDVNYAWGAYDAACFRRFGSDRAVVAPCYPRTEQFREVQARRAATKPARRVLVVSNQVANTRYLETEGHHERRYLEATFAALAPFVATRGSECRLRVHPTTANTPWHRAMVDRVLAGCGFPVSVSVTNPLVDDVEWGDMLVSPFSSVVVEAALAGRGAAVYDHDFYDRVTFVSAVPPQLRFRDEQQAVGAVAAVAADPAAAARALADAYFGPDGFVDAYAAMVADTLVAGAGREGS